MIDGPTYAVIYHDVAVPAERDDVGIPGPVAAPYKLEPDQFSANLDAIAAAGLHPGVPADGARTLLTFDDGGASAMTIASELEHRGWRGVFFIVTDRIGSHGFLDARSIVDLAARGHAIGSHTASHPSYMRRLDADALEREWIVSRDALGELLGAPPALAAVPGGSVSRPVTEAAAAAGYAVLFTSTPTARVRTFDEIHVVGRCTIWASDPPWLAAGYLSGAAGPRRRRRLAWELKSGAKRVNPRLYEALRRSKATRA